MIVRAGVSVAYLSCVRDIIDKNVDNGPRSLAGSHLRSVERPLVAFREVPHESPHRSTSENTLSYPRSVLPETRDKFDCHRRVLLECP